MLERKLSDAEVHAIVQEAVAIETEFVTSALPSGLIGINSDLMSEYVRFCADRLLVALGAPKLYNAANPFVRRSPCASQWHSVFLTATLTLTRTGWN